MPFYIKETDEVLLCYQYKKRKFVNNKDPRFVQDPFLRWIPARYIQDTKEIIDLDLEQGYDYCNLYGYVQNNIINLSYLRYQQIMFDGITPFRFYNAQFTKEWNLISENEIDIEHFWNACSDDKHHYSSANKTITVYNKQDCSIKVKYEFPLLNGIYRVIKTHSNNLLITADYKDNFYSFIFNLKNRHIYRVTIDNDGKEPVYKFCFYKDKKIMHARKNKDEDLIDCNHLVISDYNLYKDTTIGVLTYS